MSDNIRDLRKKRGLLLREVSALTGISVSWLSRIERGQDTPSPKVLLLINYVLGGNKIEKQKGARK